MGTEVLVHLVSLWLPISRYGVPAFGRHGRLSNGACARGISGSAWLSCGHREQDDGGR